MKIRTEFPFVLPKGIMNKDKNIVKTKGIMRLIKVKDILLIYQDTRVKENEGYFYIVLLARVVVSLGDERMVTTKTIENLFPEDFAFLIDFLNEINHKVIKRIPVACTSCSHKYIGEFTLLGEH
ncbi:MAG: hypothetical protein JXJ04_25715 [Spirochaetales bacterium]|nr:hypothetical protein [Spirochaetales bacterium]